MNYLDLFSGIGGFALGSKYAGMEFKNHFYSEIDDYANMVYSKHFPKAIRLGDVCNIHAVDADIITGGFPCQPFSTASHQHKTAIDLWPQMIRIIKNSKPGYICAENVSKKAIIVANGDLNGLGYKTSVKCIGAHEIGGDHKRNRWWLFAHTDDESEFFSLIDAKVAELQNMENTMWRWENYARTIRISHGLSNRMDRFRCLGNAVIPVIPKIFFESISETGCRAITRHCV